MKKTIALTTALLASLLAGCGHAPVTGADMVITQRQHLARTAPVAAKAEAVVNRTESVISIEAAPEVRGTGSIAMAFKFPTRKVLATANDINKLTVTLKTKSFLLTKTIATADVTKDKIVSGKAAIQFTGLKGGNYTVEIDAIDASNKNIGHTSEAAAVTEGQTTTLNSKLQLVADAPAASATTTLGVNVEIVNGK